MPDLRRADFDRELTSRGRKASRAIGRYLAHHGLIPDLVLCSPSARTRQTLDRVLKALDKEPPTEFLDPLYDAAVRTYLDQIRLHGGDAGTLLVVGHNPSTEEALTALCSPDSGALPDAVPTCALAVVDCGITDWAALSPGCGTLADFVRPRDLED